MTTPTELLARLDAAEKAVAQIAYAMSHLASDRTVLDAAISAAPGPNEVTQIVTAAMQQEPKP